MEFEKQPLIAESNDVGSSPFTFAWVLSNKQFNKRVCQIELTVREQSESRADGLPGVANLASLYV